VEPDLTPAREELELARATAERLWAEYSAYVKKFEPDRAQASPEAMRLVHEASEWTRRIYIAEHALFAAEHGTPGIVGSHGDYQWITSVEQDITSLLNGCPGAVLGKYLAITSIDSGTLHLTDQEQAQGWSSPDAAKVFSATSWSGPDYRGQVAYSPSVSSIHGLPNEKHDECCDGSDEWYVFDEPIPVCEMESFVNWMGFRLYDPKYKWCADRLWAQMERLRPESYIADATVFTFVTRNPTLFAQILAVFAGHPK
jgi:hypothetical protein